MSDFSIVDIGRQARRVLSEYRRRRPDDYTNFDLAVESAIVDQGTFWPDDSTVDITVTAALSSVGLAQANGFLYVGQPVTPGSLLFDISGTALPGVTVKSIGTVGVDTTGMWAASVRLTGLDTTKQVTWQVLGAIHGGSQQTVVGSDPTALAVTPDGTKLFAIREAANDVVPFTCGGRPYWSVTDSSAKDVAGTAITVGSVPVDIRANNTYAVVANFFGNSVSRITVATNAVSTFTLPDATQFPMGVGITPDGVTAWIGTATGKLYPLTLSTGAWGSPVTAGGASDGIVSVWVQPDGAALWLANNTAGSIRKMSLPGLVLSTAVAVGGAPVKVRGVDSSRVWALCATTNQLRSVLTASGTIETTISLPFATPKDIDIVPGGRTAWIGYVAGRMTQYCLTGSFAGQEVTIHRTDNASLGDIGGIAINDVGEIWHTQRTTDIVFKSPGGSISVSPGAASFFVQFIETVAQPAHA